MRDPLHIKEGIELRSNRKGETELNKTECNCVGFEYLIKMPSNVKTIDTHSVLHCNIWHSLKWHIFASTDLLLLTFFVKYWKIKRNIQVTIQMGHDIQ